MGGSFGVLRSGVARAWAVLRAVARSVAVGASLVGNMGRLMVGFVAAVLALMVAGNVLFHTPRDVPYRAPDPAAPACQAGAGWNVLADPPRADAGRAGVANDEWWAVDHGDPAWRTRFACAVQHHLLPGYVGADGSRRSIGYDLAFVEVQEDGKPYALRSPCDGGGADCRDEGYGPVRTTSRAQLDAVLDRLAEPGPHYVMVFVHGWRHNAGIGDPAVAEFRSYAAHAARFVEDRAERSPGSPKPKVMALFVGWRGARTDEGWLNRRFGAAGQAVGTFSSVLTLFDRKPVSEAIAPAVLSGLREIERALLINQPLASEQALPVPEPNRMIVFGHSLGGNLLATALGADLVKTIDRHASGSYLLPVLGDLVVLINPASEATKWTAVQRAVWDHLAIGFGERRPMQDYEASHKYFRLEQRPIVMSVTAALDWPSGGQREIDCAPRHGVNANVETSRGLAAAGVQYDWATYDLFPAFKGDFRPLADTLWRIGTGQNPHDACSRPPRSAPNIAVQLPLRALSALLRVVPFMQTDPEQTRTIGQLDPPRGIGRIASYTGRPLGTTHELRGLEPGEGGAPRRMSDGAGGGKPREISLDYDDITGPLGTCPVSDGWLDAARHRALARDPAAHATRWSSDGLEVAPALVFRHGFSEAKLPAITRANDPFWNMRAFDTALARHDGYMLTSFICAMNQLVMDQPTAFPPPAAP